MDISGIAGLILASAVQMTNLPLDDQLAPQVRVVSQEELVHTICVPGKEYQCSKYKTFNPPMSNVIYISKDLDPEKSIVDKSIIFHEMVKYVLFINQKVSPEFSCQVNFTLEARIYKLQMQYIVGEYLKLQKENPNLKFSAEDVLNYDKGTFMTYCNPNATTPEHESPRILNQDELNEYNQQNRVPGNVTF